MGLDSIYFIADVLGLSRVIPCTDLVLRYPHPPACSESDASKYSVNTPPGLPGLCTDDRLYYYKTCESQIDR